MGFGAPIAPCASETRIVKARSALFDLYGDHLLSRGEQAPVAALVRLLAPLRISAPAVRTAVSRMARQGWLSPVRLPEGAGYRLTPRGVHRLQQAADRIYRLEARPWDARWHVIVVERIGDRAGRERLRSALEYLGYASLDSSTWVSPFASVELDALLASERVGATSFHASFDGDARALAARAWDIDGLARAYQEWLDRADAIVPAPDQPAPDERTFAARSELVHEWRKFLFTDPGLPAQLLPAGWPGAQAAELFRAEAERLRPGAARFVDCCLSGGQPRPPRDRQATADEERQ
jgi:phenylacetic acid degradation operon negative regulatory protein